MLTLGVYSVYWWYAVNREMAEVGRATDDPELGERPGLSALAFGVQTAPGVVVAVALAYLTESVVPAFIWMAAALVFGVATIVRTCIRIRRLQRRAGIPDPTSGWLFGVVWVLISAGGPLPMQQGLNRAWEALEPAEA